MILVNQSQLCDKVLHFTQCHFSFLIVFVENDLVNNLTDSFQFNQVIDYLKW